MQDTLAYSLEELKDIYEKATNYKNIYKDSLEKIIIEIDKLANNWQTDESGAYLKYKESFLLKQKKLQEALSMMETFLKQLEIKIQELSDASIEVENIFL